MLSLCSLLIIFASRPEPLNRGIDPKIPLHNKRVDFRMQFIDLCRTDGWSRIAPRRVNADGILWIISFVMRSILTTGPKLCANLCIQSYNNFGTTLV